MRNTVKFRSILTTVVALGLFLSLASCGGGGGDSGSIAGSSGTITVYFIDSAGLPSLTSPSVPADGNSSVILHVEVKDSAGNPVRHFTEVSFSTTMGHFRNGATTYTVQTQPPMDDKGWPDTKAAPTGVVETALIAGNDAGTAKVTISSNGISAAAYVSFTKQEYKITLTAQPSHIPVDSTSFSTIKALVTLIDGDADDTNDVPVPYGTTVTFITNLGLFKDVTGTYTNTLVTVTQDNTGKVSAKLYSRGFEGSAKVAVISMDAFEFVYVGFGTIPVNIQITAAPITLPADGVSSSIITAIVTKSDGQPVDAGTNVTFSTGMGTFSNGAKTFKAATTLTTDAVPKAIVNVPFVAGVVPGTTYIEAMSNDVTQALSFVLTKTSPPYSEMTVDANPSRIPADGKSQSLITATVTRTQNVVSMQANTAGQPVSGVPITFYKITSNVEPQPLPDANTYIGDGTSIAGPFYSYGGLTSFYITAVMPTASTDEGYFILWLLNPLTDERILLFSRDGFFGTILDDESVSLLPGNYQLEIQTNAYYEIKVVGNIGPAQTGKIVLGFTKTGANGVASYTYTADWLPGSFNIKAETGELSNSENALSQEVIVTQTADTPDPIEISTAKTSLYANGMDTSTVTAQVWIDGNKVPDGTVVYFSTTSGSINASAVTVDGLASATLTSSVSATSFACTITARAGANSASTSVTFVGVSLTNMKADPNTIFANGTDTSTITVRLKNDLGIAIPDETIIFSSTSGSLSSNGVSLTDAEGLATVVLTAPLTAGKATISANYGLIKVSTSTTFVEAPVVGSITLTADPEIIQADGSSSSTITAEVKDGAGAPVPKGTSVDFTTTRGTFANGTTSYSVITPDANGKVSVSLRSGTTGGSAIVSATSNSVTQSVVVLFTSSVVSKIALSASSYSLRADGVSTSEIRARVTDSNGNPVPNGEQISFVILSGPGTLNGSVAATVGGVASVTYRSAANQPGTATIQAMATNSVSDTLSITLTSPDLGTITLKAEPTEIPADGSSSSTITATILNSTGKPVLRGTEVVFSTNLGTFRNGSASYTKETEDDTGIVTVALIAGNTPGVANVKAESGGVSNLVKVTFGHAGNTGVPVAEEFSLSAQYLNITGLWMASLQDIVTASVGDVFGNAVQDNTVIFFKTYNTGGFFNKDQDYTVAGLASSTLFTSGGPTPLQGFAFMTGETEGGPTTRVSSLAVTPYPDQHILYAGTNGGGVYKSTDYGASWRTVSRSTENQKQGQNVIDPYVKGQSAICVDPDDHNTVYVGTGYLGKGNVYRSMDGGNNWNSNNVEEWNGLFDTNAAVISVLCDGGNSPYVWIGTEGRGPLYATDGETFQPSNGIASSPIFIGSGNGAMSHPILWYSSKTETWTASCVVVNGTVSTPSFTGVGDGYMSNVTTSPTTKTENWTVIYKSIPGTPSFTGTGNGSVRNIRLTKPNAAAETWTLRCESVAGTISAVTGTATGKGGIVQGIAIDFATHTEKETFTLTAIDPTTFEVKSSLGRTYPNADVEENYDQNGVQFKITTPTEAYEEEDTFVFTYTPGVTIFSVRSSVAGFYPEAEAGTTYDEDGLSFLINQGSTPFAVGDAFTFTTTSAWRVTGSVSGVQTNTATTGTAYTSDNNEVGFTIFAGGIPFQVDDTFTFDTIEGITYWNVAGTVSGLQNKRAFNNRFYISDNMEVRFVITEGSTPFANGDAFTFTVAASNLGHGWNVWDIVRVPGTHGSTAVLYAGTSVGVYKSANGAQTWSSRGAFTGDFITTLALYPTATGLNNDILYAGTQNAGVWGSANSGGTWTQYAGGMDSGISANIKDLVLDPVNKKIYAVTFNGPVAAATGKVYVHDLNADGTMAAGDWREAMTGLTSEAFFTIAVDQPSNPYNVYAGGEGISLFRASGGLNDGALQWYESKTGLENLIMARMPILFTGQTSLSYIPVYLGGSRFYFEVYMEDINGNPPIVGSTFEAITYNAQGGEIETIYTKTYGDNYVEEGTYRDPSNPTTNIPIVTPVVDFSGDDANRPAKVEFTFTPACNTAVPGCSGAAQVAAFGF